MLEKEVDLPGGSAHVTYKLLHYCCSVKQG